MIVIAFISMFNQGLSSETIYKKQKNERQGERKKIYLYTDDWVRLCIQMWFVSCIQFDNLYSPNHRYRWLQHIQ